ncbi:MAG: NAD(P)/FAD-dependent oxidoreductase [Firmicutes bacterium]|nr:NAD(P)/FAD-dependent oxidoreductase [Bacillota bacterium]
MNVVVIGGGASGLTAAIYAAKNGCLVTILERNKTCGKKILVTGNGRCNYWNHDQDKIHYHSNNPELLEKILTDENNNKVLEFFDGLGIIPKIKNNYYYPCTNQAITIQETLLNELKRLNVSIKNEFYVEKIEKNDQVFEIFGNNEIIKADKVIIATGSKACAKTGSDGNGYNLVEKFNHKIEPVLPSLVQLRGNENYFKLWDGVRTEGKVTIEVDGIKEKEEFGEIQCTSYGISGICVFNISSIASYALYQNKKVIVKLNFIPWLKEPNKKEWLNNYNQKLKNRTIYEMISKFLNTKLVDVILKKTQIDKNKTWDSLSSKEQDKLIENLTGFSLPIIETNSFDNAQVCRGGVSLTEISTTTMESLKIKGLYFTGEILDVDGDCGGYNLGFAWLSGIIAGNSVGDIK